MCAKCVLSLFSRIGLFVTPWTVAQQTPLSMGFSSQEYWSGLPFPSPVDLPDLGIEPMSLVSPTLADEFFTTSTTCEALEENSFPCLYFHVESAHTPWHMAPLLHLQSKQCYHFVTILPESHLPLSLHFFLPFLLLKTLAITLVPPDNLELFLF